MSSFSIRTLDADGFALERLFEASIACGDECIGALDKFRDTAVESLIFAPLPGLDGRCMVIANTDVVIDKRLRFAVEMVHLCLAMTIQRIEAESAAKVLEFEADQLAAQIAEIKNDLRVSREISGTGFYKWDIENSDNNYWSDELYEILDYDRAVHKPIYENVLARLHPEDLQSFAGKIDAALSSKTTYKIQYRVIRPDGSIRHLYTVGRPEKPDGNLWSALLLDLTDRNRILEEVRIAQSDLNRMSRLMTVGQLGASVAHELNQPLTSIVANVGATIRWLENSPPDMDIIRSGVTAVLVETRRAAGVIKSLRDLSRKSDPVLIEVAVNEVVREVLPLLSSEVALHGISLTVSLSETEAVIIADKVQLQQVLLALVMNGIEAMSSNNGTPRTLEVSVSLAGSAVEMSVTDSGGGISPEHAHLIFDPLYSTKDSSLGLGLTISRSIIEAHGGSLRHLVDERKTTFSVCLPTGPVVRENGACLHA
ncbi:ATP-binding protein [Agrobacterium vitis]|uniref:ATP-binding protein n=1 Tax=Agrobacterium vitis TaxID=373 RepID=UPI002035BE30|nr:ATP-binding protein [Agrobacterium vitis]MCM2450083.1 PAS domain-containing protein [Agrobacterium vitis]